MKRVQNSLKRCQNFYYIEDYVLYYISIIYIYRKRGADSIRTRGSQSPSPFLPPFLGSHRFSDWLGFARNGERSAPRGGGPPRAGREERLSRPRKPPRETSSRSILAPRENPAGVSDRRRSALGFKKREKARHVRRCFALKGGRGLSEELKTIPGIFFGGARASRAPLILPRTALPLHPGP